ncbi:MAG: molybdopterin-dependent oxidoreductase [Acidobacteriaceae bacterium]
MKTAPSPGKTMPATETRVTACRMCGNKAWCSINVTLQDGVIVKIEGDTANPVSHGKLCARGQAAVYNLYNPYRVKAPMKRTNPKKGFDQDPGWVEISWEEALSTVADRLRRIRQEDARKFAHMWGFGGDWWVVQHEAFLPAFGTPNLLRSHGVLCPVHYGCSLVQGTMLDKQDVEYCEYLVTIGGSLGPNIGSSHSTHALARARERGIKLIVVDPRCSHEATLAHEWIPIRPGTDLAFSLALLNVILNEIGIFDEPFLKRRTNAVYLIDEDGYYALDPTTRKPLIWDPADQQAKVFDDQAIRDYALEGRYPVSGKLLPTAFTLVKEAMRSYSPEWAEEITTVPAATLRRVATEFVGAAKIGEAITLDGVEFPFRPTLVKGERGSLGKYGGAYQHLLHKMINMVVGSLDVPGGDLGSETGPVLSPGPDGVVSPKKEAIPVPFRFPPDIDLAQFYPNRHTLPHIAWKAILDPEKYGIPYNIEALMIYGGNPITNNSNPDEAAAALCKIPFIVTIAYIFDEAAGFSDILLPEPALLERYGIQELGTGHFVQAQDADMLQVTGVLARVPVLPVPTNTRQADDIYLELAERVGFLYGPGGLNDHLNQFWNLQEPHKLDLTRRYTTPEILDRILKSKFAIEQGLDYFTDSGVYYHIRSQAESYNSYYYPLGTTRYAFYFEHLLRTGDTLRHNLAAHHLSIPAQDMADVWRFYRAIPHWVGRPDEKAHPDYDLVAMNWSTPQFRMHSSDQTSNPVLNEIATEADPYQFVVLMNRETAARKGLREGEEVLVEAYWGGKTQGTLKLTSLLHPDALGLPGSHGFKSLHCNPSTMRGPHFNSLLNSAEGSFDPLHGGIDRNPRVKVSQVRERDS